MGVLGEYLERPSRKRLGASKVARSLHPTQAAMKTYIHAYRFTVNHVKGFQSSKPVHHMGSGSLYTDVHPPSDVYKQARD